MIEHINLAARAEHLEVFGALHEDGDTIVLLGPYEPGFWAHVSTAPELNDGCADPLDRWSKRVISALVRDFGGSAIFPSDGPPYAPFISWALQSDQSWLSPAGLLVHAHAGLFASYRGALRIVGEHTLPPKPVKPCASCAAPCTLACPVNALQATSYDVEACKAHISGPDTADCRSLGCAVRRACPISQNYGRKDEQSAFHMRAFLGE